MGQVIPQKPLRVVVWSTATIGRHLIAGVDAHPDLELVGVWTSTLEKHGKDAGDLTGLIRDGVNVFSGGPVILLHRTGTLPDEMIAGIEEAGRQGTASLHVNG